MSDSAQQDQRTASCDKSFGMLLMGLLLGLIIGGIGGLLVGGGIGFGFAWFQSNQYEKEIEGTLVEFESRERDREAHVQRMQEQAIEQEQRSIQLHKELESARKAYEQELERIRRSQSALPGYRQSLANLARDLNQPVPTDHQIVTARQNR